MVLDPRASSRDRPVGRGAAGKGRYVKGREDGDVVVGGGSVREYVPGWRFYVVLAVSVVASLSLGLYVASRFGWEETAWTTIWFWLSYAVVAGLVVPDLLQYAVLRRFGARPRRIRWTERGNGPLFAWWRTPDHWLTRRRFVVSYGAPVLLSCTVLTTYAVEFPTAAPVLGLIVPFYLGNLWCALIVLRKPDGTLVQLFGRDLRFRAPAGQAFEASG